MSIDRRRALLALAGGASTLIACRSISAAPEPQRGKARVDLYACEGCGAVAERRPDALSATLQLASAQEPGERMILTGRVLSSEGKPAVGVVVYAHHTNQDGLYANGTQETEWSRRHGRLRGWVKTGMDGVFTFRTIKPAPYPDMTGPAHIHLFIGEPGKRPYYIDDVVFDGEFGVTAAYRQACELRGGSGIVRLVRTGDGMLLARRDIWLEAHPA